MFRKFRSRVREIVVGIIATAVVLISPGALIGCASVQNHEATAKLTVTYATIKGIEQGLDAAEVRRIAEEVKSLMDGEATTVTLLESAVRIKLSTLGLSPADQFLAGQLVEIVAQELIARTGGPGAVLQPDQILYVSKVMDWIIAGVELSGNAS